MESVRPHLRCLRRTELAGSPSQNGILDSLSRSSSGEERRKERAHVRGRIKEEIEFSSFPPPSLRLRLPPSLLRPPIFHLRPHQSAAGRDRPRPAGPSRGRAASSPSRTTGHLPTSAPRAAGPLREAGAKAMKLFPGHVSKKIRPRELVGSAPLRLNGKNMYC